MRNMPTSTIKINALYHATELVWCVVNFRLCSLWCSLVGLIFEGSFLPFVASLLFFRCSFGCSVSWLSSNSVMICAFASLSRTSFSIVLSLPSIRSLRDLMRRLIFRANFFHSTYLLEKISVKRIVARRNAEPYLQPLSIISVVWIMIAHWEISLTVIHSAIRITANSVSFRSN